MFSVLQHIRLYHQIPKNFTYFLVLVLHRQYFQHFLSQKFGSTNFPRGCSTFAVQTIVRLSNAILMLLLNYNVFTIRLSNDSRLPDPSDPLVYSRKLMENCLMLPGLFTVSLQMLWSAFFPFCFWLWRTVWRIIRYYLLRSRHTGNNMNYGISSILSSFHT